MGMIRELNNAFFNKYSGMLRKKRTIAYIKKAAVPDVWVMPWKPTGRPWSEGKPSYEVQS